MLKTDILIIGGGLAGLSLADQLHHVGIDFQLVEARQRFGGRIKVLEHADGAYDLGPSWFWPGQSRMALITRRFEIPVFEQYSSGALSYEDENGHVARNKGWASMQGSLRLEGGMTALILNLVNSLPAKRLQPNLAIARIVRRNGLIEVYDKNGKQVAIVHNLVLAIPPRLVSQLVFDPPLKASEKLTMQTVPTWMAGHAKFVAVYETPFWRDAGLSGDAMSRRGPMVEMHDASDPRTGAGAIFGFLGIHAQIRSAHNGEVEQACIDQLARIFNADGIKPLVYKMEDWAFEKHTAIEADHIAPAGHPHYGLPSVLCNLWDGNLILGSTEIATEFGGFLEGALEAADAVFKKLTADLSANSD